MTDHTFTMTEAKAELVHAVVSDRCQSIKNWMAGAVESGDLEYAQRLVKQLRDYETLFAAFNMPAKHQIADGSKKPLETNHRVR